MEDMPSRSEMHREKSQGNNSQGNGNGPKEEAPRSQYRFNHYCRVISWDRGLCRANLF